jgi:tetratricopeptide (TPR) repeat protein
MRKMIPLGASTMVLAAIAFAVPSISFAQEPGGGQTAPPQTQGPPGGQQPPGGRQPSVGQPPNQDRTQQNPFPNEIPRQIFLTGSVRLSDGTLPPANVVIERVCNGVVRPEGYTDSKGNFSITLGSQNAAVFADASIGNDPLSGGFPGGGGRQNGINVRDLTGCEIRANLAGFQSDSILLAFREALDNPEIGIIHLRRLANVEGFTFSVTTALASKDARKAYEKGLDLAKKQKWPDAEREFTKAVEAYPKYAVAWYELGRVHQQLKKLDEANRAHAEAIKIDSKFINPYGQLVVIAVVQQKWEDVALYTSQLLKLNPYLAPEIYFYSAVANYNLHKLEVAEGHARQAAKLDAQHKTPRINHLLGLILAQKQDYKDAAENMRIYLKFSPDASDAAEVKQMLSEVEKADDEQQPKP